MVTLEPTAGISIQKRQQIKEVTSINPWMVLEYLFSFSNYVWSNEK